VTPFPWSLAIGFGLGVLRLSPQQFWSMTPRELGYAVEAVMGRASPLDRGTLAQLIERYPDDNYARPNDRA
jgi:uncharacterized phage protein (TIGR02216 family)